jgi:hypothetical protein
LGGFWAVGCEKRGIVDQSTFRKVGIRGIVCRMFRYPRFESVVGHYCRMFQPHPRVSSNPHQHRIVTRFFNGSVPDDRTFAGLDECLNHLKLNKRNGIKKKERRETVGDVGKIIELV